jgi:CHAT domain-containing protein
VLVDYFLHDGMLAAISLSRDGVVGHPSLIREPELGQIVHSLLFDLRGAAFAPVHERPSGDLNDGLAELAALLLWPILREPPGDRWPTSLAIVPAGPLARLPWAAFPLPDGRALCEAMELVVVPGLRLSMIGASAKARATPEGEGHDPPLVVASDAGELQSVVRETRAVTDHFPGARLLTGTDASAERFLEAAPRAPWIHFAGHGHFRADAPHESALLFADRWLLADELAELRLSASWVGLSACQTARALVRPGEEWFGLARSFLLSGARTVLASQWDIEDDAAARLMADLYRRLAAGDSLGRALSGAQASRFRDGAPPLEWAGFVILGAPGPVETPNRRPRSGPSKPPWASATITAHLEVLP